MKNKILEYFWELRPDLDQDPGIVDLPLRQVISSVEFVGFLCFLEEDLGIQLDDAQITEENFASLKTLLALLESLGH
jgi:acyl carrier protein